VSRVAIVTGGGTGIGRAAALALHRDGCRLVLCGRRPQPLDEVCGLIGEAECAVLAGDIREPDVADALVDLALERFGRIDVLVNNAGGQFMAPAEDITPNGWAAVRRLNLDAPWYLTQQVAKRWMIANGGGRIVSVVLCPTRGIPGMVHSSAARAGTEAVARVLSVEWGRYDIGVVCVAPGWIDTDGMRQYGDDLEQLAELVPMRRLGSPEEVGDTIAFLASPQARYITGQTIVIDGGIDNTHTSLPGVTRA
jgi:citronellol/citronellal dehydrogenase